METQTTKYCKKNVYSTRGLAKKVMKARNKKVGHKEVNHTYYCEKCQGYHMTSMPKWKQESYEKHQK